MATLIAADTGGTFTDVVVADGEGRIAIAKALTTYDHPTQALQAGLDRSGDNLSSAESFRFGTTLVINALLERKGAKTGLVCTHGFRDTLEIRRGNRVAPFDLRYAPDPALVERRYRYEVKERTDAAGKILVPLDLPEIERIATAIRDAELEAVGISFINAYANDGHERATTELLRSLLPGVYVTAGSELTREWYEYERTSTVAANAYVGPRLEGFITTLERHLVSSGFDGDAFLMASNGGVLTFDESRRRPVQLVESGPVGGCIGAAAYAAAMGVDRMIAFDMGGTTAKCALIENGTFETRSPYHVGGREKGFPVRGSVVDIVEVGAGGGSIASVDAFGRLTVGPRSAGSAPGPACYGRGGEEATVTDANVLLGRLAPERFLAGEMSLDLDAARRVMMEKIARPLGYDEAQIAEVAQGVLTIATIRMSQAIAEITTERGRDPRDYSLFVFGGGGPLHGVELARMMGIPEVIVPPRPGVFSAVGMLCANALIEETATFLRRLDNVAVYEMELVYRDMAGRAIERLPGSAGLSAIILRHAELRYVGQRHAMKIAVSDPCSAEALAAAFHHIYRQRYGFADNGAPIEVVSLLVGARLPLHTLAPDAMIPRDEGEAGADGEETRLIWLDAENQWLHAPVVSRGQLGSARRHGPLVIEEYGATIILGPADTVTVGSVGELRIQVGATQ